MLYNCFRNVLRVSATSIKQSSRFISTSKSKCFPSSYEGEGKTTAHILNSESENALLINGISEVGFRLNNDVTILGPMIIFPRFVLSWNVGSIEDITEESLSLFTVLEPSIDLIILGVGNKPENPKFYQNLLPFMRKQKINLEVLPTEQACSTFNFLSYEGRFVGGALIPPQILQTTDDDLLRTKLRYQHLYELDY